MPYLKNYLDKIIERGNTGLAESISATAEDVGNNYLKKFSFTSHEIGLLFGNVQSGKTGQMFGIMCKATDLGFPVFVLLTTVAYHSCPFSHFHHAFLFEPRVILLTSISLFFS